MTAIKSGATAQVRTSSGMAGFHEADQRSSGKLKKFDADRVADGESRRGMAHQPRAFVQVDEHKGVRREGAEFLGRRAGHHGRRVNDSAPRGLAPFEAG